VGGVAWLHDGLSSRATQNMLILMCEDRARELTSTGLVF
jgi:hypothetical protein